MLLRLVRAHLTRPLSGLRTLRILGAYRRAQERLRRSATISADLAGAQIQLTCERTGADPASIAECVARWMEQVPLDLVGRGIQPGLLEFLHACRGRGVRLGVVSDYPPHAKLSALGLDGLFDVVLAAQSAGVGVFKPHPRGLLLAAELLRLSPADCVYVGDRVDVDGAAAAAAGMPCVIVTRRTESPTSGAWTPVAGYPQLQSLFSSGQRLMRPAAPQPTLNGG
jgi:HAD superfamily hydrolase (TIGR01509 family)